MSSNFNTRVQLLATNHANLLLASDYKFITHYTLAQSLTLTLSFEF